jgi:hypothetical protein
MMKYKKIILIAIIGFFVYFAVYKRYVHSHSWDTVCKQYLWLFRDSSMSDLIEAYGHLECASYIKKNDTYNSFPYSQDGNMFPIIIWEFKDMKNADLNKIITNQHIDLSRVGMRGEILDAQSSRPVTVKYTAAFHNAMIINLDGLSKIDGTFAGPNYKGFYGSINQMTFSNEKGEPQILFDYSDKPYKDSFSPSVFILYKGHQSFYVIIVNSKQPFKDASIINIFNLQ